MATRVVVERGFQRLTIRRLAAELGVAPMSLYRHVHSKDDLLNEVVDRMLAHAREPTQSAGEDWQAWIIEAADKLRQFLIEQPAALHIYLSHPVVSPSAIARMETVMAVLRAGLGDEQRAQQAYAAIHTYTIGFAALEASRAASAGPNDLTPTPLATQLASYTSAEQFTTGLNYLLLGFADQSH
jgi:AcrR family transcriptional regulator